MTKDITSENRLIEIYLTTQLEVCTERDIKVNNQVEAGALWVSMPGCLEQTLRLLDD